MKMDDVMEIITPTTDSHYRLVPCKCGSDNVAYTLGADGRWRAHCFECGHTGPGDMVRHGAQVKWNKEAKHEER